MSAVRRPLLFVAALLLNAVTVDAHSLAGTIVTIALDRPGMVTVTITAEADPLIAKLEALAGVTSSPPLTSADRRARLESLFPTLRAHIDGQLDARPLDFTLRDAIVDETAQVEIHLAATVPAGPHTFTWRSTFIFGAYQLAITRGDASDTVQWLQGPQASTPIALEPSRARFLASALGLTGIRIGHGLAMGALVVYVLTRRRLVQRAAGG